MQIVKYLIIFNLYEQGPRTYLKGTECVRGLESICVFVKDRLSYES